MLRQVSGLGFMDSQKYLFDIKVRRILRYFAFFEFCLITGIEMTKTTIFSWNKAIWLNELF